MEAYEKLIKAIILTESKGKGTDLMQSSESLHGEADIIDNPADSIDQGVKYLAEMIMEAKNKDVICGPLSKRIILGKIILPM